MSYSSDLILNKISIIFCVLIILLTVVYIVFEVMFLINDTVRSEYIGTRRINITKSNIGGMILRLLLVFVLFALTLSLLILEIKVIKEEDPYQRKKLQEEAKKMRIASFSYFGVLIVGVFMYLYFAEEDEAERRSRVEKRSKQSGQSLLSGNPQATSGGKDIADESEKEAEPMFTFFPDNPYELSTTQSSYSKVSVKTSAGKDKTIALEIKPVSNTKLGISKTGDLWLVRLDEAGINLKDAKQIMTLGKIDPDIQKISITYNKSQNSDTVIITDTSFIEKYKETFPRDK